MEPNLNLKVVDLKAKCGSFAGWGRGNVAPYTDREWSTQQQQVIDDAVQSGLRRFYFPAPVDPSGSSYNWSFLIPAATAVFLANTQTVLLPEDFGGIEGMLTVATQNSTLQPWKIDWRNEGQIREMYSVTPLQTGPPMYAAPRPQRGVSLNNTNRWELFLFPEADQNYTLQFTYYVNPNYLDGTAPYAYGGAQHAETILESCLAVMEERLDDASTVHAAAFQARLMASMSMDRRNKVQKIGYNQDRSDDRNQRANPHWFAPAVTYNGGSFG